MTTHLCIRPFACIRFFAIAGLAWCAFSAIARSAEPQTQAALLTTAQAATYSLADDFSYTDNRTNSTWSYRLDDFANNPPTFPLLTSTNRDANALWGSDFPTPPMMWSEATGYWGIGKNVTGKELFSTKNGTRWAPGEVLFHPKGGDSPSGLVVGWTAPSSMVIDVRYAFGLGATQGNGIGYKIIKRCGGVDAEVVALDNIGSSLSNELTGIVVAQGDQLFFRFDTCGDPGGDISRAAINIKGMPGVAAQAIAAQPSGGTIAAGSDFTFSVPATGARTFQWRKDGQAIPGATNASHRIRDVKMTDAGAYSVVIDSVPSGNALLNVTPKQPLPEKYSSPVPRQVFSATLAEQEKELKTNVLMLRFAESRKRLAADSYRPAYHFVSPESQMNDPNGLCFWQGRWHMFYQAFPADKFPEPRDLRDRLLQSHWGHAVTDDWVHWRDLPYALYPGIEKVCASGGTVVEENRVVAFYPGWEAGQMVAIAKDPLLLNWEKIGGNPVRSPAGDSCIWKEGDTYFGLVGADCLVSSKNLVDWTVHGGFLEGNPFPLGDAGACPNFVPIGNKHLLLSFSHTTGGQYLLGDYDKRSHKFKPYAHGRLNHGTVAPGGVHAPSAVADGKGGVINILNINDGKHSDDWDQLMSLAQRLTLGPDSQLRIEPVDAVASLRGTHQHVGETRLPANQEIVLDAIKGNTLELEVEIDPQMSRWVQLNVLRSPNAEEQTSITFYNYDRKLAFWYHTQGVICLDGSRSSNLPDVWLRPPERAVLERGQGETLKLRIFIDRSVVEVFANGKQYMAMRVYPGRKDSVGVSIRAQGQDAVLKKLDAWQMQSIWP
jgi:beta-fructofuranosidase